MEPVRALTRGSSRWAALGLGALFLVVAGLTLSLVLGLRRGRTAPAADDAAPVPGRARVEVMNGSGRRGLARETVRRLRAAGWDVVAYGNTAPAQRSEVIARGRQIDQARQVAELLGIRRVRVAPDSGRLVDLTVLLGADAPPSAPTGPPATERP